MDDSAWRTIDRMLGSLIRAYACPRMTSFQVKNYSFQIFPRNRAEATPLSKMRCLAHSHRTIKCLSGIQPCLHHG